MGLLILAAGFCAACGYVVPLLARLSRIDVAEGLRASSSRLFSGSRPLRQFLVAAQVAGCVALLMGAVWLTESFYRLLTANPGFQAEKVVTFASSLPGRVYHSPQLRAGFARRMTARLAAISGVEASGAVSDLPLSGQARRGVYAFPHSRPQAISEGMGQGQADLRYVIPGYFETMQIRLLSGRLFQSADLEQNLSVAVIDAALARQGWPDGDAVGERILLPTSDGDVSRRTVIGVVETVRQRDLADSGGRQIYLTMADRSVSRMFFVLRHAPGVMHDWNQQIRQAVAEVDPRVGIAFVRPMSQWVRSAASRTRLLALLLGTFAAVSLLLSGMALHAALATLTQERRQEIGLRLALGARPADIIRWVVSRALGVTLMGSLAGLLMALAGWKLYGRLLYQVAPTDWRALLFALLALALLAACSILHPAHRASRTHPSTALRGS